MLLDQLRDIAKDWPEDAAIVVEIPGVGLGYQIEAVEYRERHVEDDDGDLSEECRLVVLRAKERD